MYIYIPPVVLGDALPRPDGDEYKLPGPKIGVRAAFTQ